MYKVILFADLPKVKDEEVKDEESNERDATVDELMQMDIHVFDRGAQRVQVICNGYLNNDTKEPEDGQGNPWPGEVLAGGPGMYRDRRLPLIEESLNNYKGGNNGGRKRLTLDKRPEELPRADGEGGMIPPVNLTKSERLARNLPRISGDG